MLLLTELIIVTAFCLSNLAVFGVAKPARPSEVNTHCGRVLSVGVNAPATINYKLNEDYDNEEQCIWTIRVADAQSSGLRFIKRQSGFEQSYDFLQLSSFRNNNLIRPTETRTLGNVNDQEETNMTAHVIFAVFSTDDSNTGTGFSLEIEAISGNRYTDVYTDFFTDTEEGNTTLNPYLNNMFSTFVITANNVDALEMGVFYDTETLSDLLSVFHCERNGGRIVFFPYGLMSGQSNRYFTLKFYTTFVLIFHSDYSYVAEGIELTWKHGKESVTKNSLLD